MVYPRQKTETLLNGSQSFEDFCNTTNRLMLGSKNEMTRHEAVNILTILSGCEKKYSGDTDVFAKIGRDGTLNWNGMYRVYLLQ